MAESRKTSTKSEKPKPASKPAAAKKSAPTAAKAMDTKKESAGKPAADTAAPAKPGMTSPPKTEADRNPDQNSYEVVSPPTPIDRSHKGNGIVGFLLSLIIIAVLMGGIYVTWPSWSPYVADRFPMLEYKPNPDPLLSKLTDRINALEAEAQGRSAAEQTIAEMEKERARLQDGVKSLLARLNEVESAVGNVKQMIAATGVGAESEEARQSFQRIAERLADLEKRGGAVADLTQRLSNMEAVGTGDADLAIKRAEEANQRLNEAVSNIESRLTEFENQRGQPATEDAGATAAATATAMVLAISQLRKTILSGQPFDKDLEAIQAVSDDDHGMKAALLVLGKHATSGVATLADLRERFSQTAGSIVAAAGKTQGGSWIENAANRLRSFIAIRQIDGNAPESSVDSYVLRAESSLKASDLQGAVKALEGLEKASPLSAKAASDWIAAARARLSAERAVSSLHVYAVSLIAAAKE